MRIPIALITGIILPLSVGHVACSTNGEGLPAPDEVKLKYEHKDMPGDNNDSDTVSLEAVWKFPRESNPTKPAPGSNDAKTEPGKKAVIKVNGNTYGDIDSETSAGNGWVTEDSELMYTTQNLGGTDYSGALVTEQDSEGWNTVLY